MHVEIYHCIFANEQELKFKQIIFIVPKCHLVRRPVSIGQFWTFTSNAVAKCTHWLPYKGYKRELTGKTYIVI